MWARVRARRGAGVGRAETGGTTLQIDDGNVGGKSFEFVEGPNGGPGSKAELGDPVDLERAIALAATCRTRRSTKSHQKRACRESYPRPDLLASGTLQLRSPSNALASIQKTRILRSGWASRRCPSPEVSCSNPVSFRVQGLGFRV